MNLVPGGARAGYFQTRQSRVVLLTEEFDYFEPPQPGMEPVSRKCWKGLLYEADGKRVETSAVWEQSGAFQNPTGVTSRNDLVIFMRAPDPKPAAELAPTKV